MVDDVLVTGSSGTIGTSLALRLQDDGYTVTGIDKRENRWSSEVEEITLRHDLTRGNLDDLLSSNLDYVVHLAANARVYELVKQPEL